MAVTTTTNLKLKVDSSLTPDSKFNLYKIDDLASLYQVDSNAIARVRSQTDIILQPHDPDIGGTGSGGTIFLGTDDQPASTIKLRALSLDLEAEISSSNDIGTTGAFVLQNGNYGISLQAPTLGASYSLTFPTSDGTVNQVLTTNGAGELSWSTVAGAGSGGQELAASWTVGDGPTKTIVHGFSTQSIMVQVLDVEDDYKTVEVDAVCRPDANTILLESSITPVNWLVLLKEI